MERLTATTRGKRTLWVHAAYGELSITHESVPERCPATEVTGYECEARLCGLQESAKADLAKVARDF